MYIRGNNGSLSRINNLDKQLRSSGLAAFRHSFQDGSFTDGLSVEYFADLDRYFVSNGQHRATMAKVTGASPLFCPVVLNFRVNPGKQKVYDSIQELQSRNLELLRQLDFTLSGKRIQWGNKPVFSISPAFPSMNLSERLLEEEKINKWLSSIKTAAERQASEHQKLVSPFLLLLKNRIKFNRVSRDDEELIAFHLFEKG